MYADDVKLFNKVEKLEDARKLQKDIDSLNDWCKENNLNLNVKKCFVMSTTRKKVANVHMFNYNINSTPLNRTTSFKDLGITFDSKLFSINI